MKIKFYFDEDAMANQLVNEMRARGIDILTALEAGTIGKNDASQLEFATSQGRVLYSFNVGDFCRLHGAFAAKGKQHAGIVLAPQQRFPIGEQLRRLIRLATLVQAEEMQNRLEFLSAWG